MWQHEYHLEGSCWHENGMKYKDKRPDSVTQCVLCASRSLLNQNLHPDQHSESSTPGALRKLETLLSSISARVIWWGWHCPVCIELHLHPWKGCWGPRAQLQPPADPSLSTQLLEPPSGLGSAQSPLRGGGTQEQLCRLLGTPDTLLQDSSVWGEPGADSLSQQGAHAAPFLVSHLKCTFGKMARHYKYWALFGKSNINWNNLLLFL